MAFDLTEKQIGQIKGVLAEYPEVKEVRLFGSRAKGTQSDGSDIDMALKGDDITHTALLNLRGDLNALNLPYTFDTVIYSNIKEPALKVHINRKGVTFYKRSVLLKDQLS